MFAVARLRNIHNHDRPPRAPHPDRHAMRGLAPAAWILVLALAMPGRAAHADEARLADAPEAADTIARALAAYEAGRLVEARRWFMLAHEQEPNARTLRGLGVVSHALGDYVEAISFLEAALRHPVRPLTPALRELVARLIADAQSQLGRIEVRDAPPGTVVRLDGSVVTLDDGAGVYATPGTHQLRLTLPEEPSLDREIEIGAGAIVRIAVRAVEPTDHARSVTADEPNEGPEREGDASMLAVDPHEAELVTDAPAEANDAHGTRRVLSPSPGPRGHVRRRRIALAMASAGGGVIVVGSTLLVTARVRYGALARSCADGCPIEVIEARWDSRHIGSLAIAGDVALALGAVSSLASGLVWWTRPRGSTDDVVLIGPGSIDWRRSF